MNEKYLYENYLQDSYNKYKLNEERKYYFIITFDLSNASSIAYKEINECLTNSNFSKIIAKKNDEQKYPYDFMDTPNNTYLGTTLVKNRKELNMLRNKYDRFIKDILDKQLDYGQIDGYNYLIFVAATWAWGAGQKKRYIAAYNE